MKLIHYNIDRENGERHHIDLSSPQKNPEHREAIERYKFAARLLKAGDVVLDVACGGGYGSEILVDAGAKKVYGIDIDQKTIKEAESRYDSSKIHFLSGDAEKINFPSNFFDFIVSFETMEHLEKPREFLKEAKRVLKRGGIFVLSTPNRDVNKFQILYMIHWLLYRKPPNLFHVTEFSQRELTRLFEEFSSVELFGQRFIAKKFLNYPFLILFTLCEKLLISGYKSKAYRTDFYSSYKVRRHNRPELSPLCLIVVCRNKKKK